MAADSLQTYLNGLMVDMVGLLLGTLLTGVLLSLTISSLPLLSSRGGDKNLLKRNQFLRVYIIILLSAVLIFEAEVFVVMNSVAIFFSQSQDVVQFFFKIWGKVTGITTAVIVLLSDGILVRL